MAFAAVAALAGVLVFTLDFRCLGHGLFGFGFEVDFKSGGEPVAADKFTRIAGWLHGAQHPVVVLCMLQVVFGQDSVAAGLGVSRQLLIFLKNALGGTAYLDALGTVGVEGTVGIVLRLAAVAATAARAAIAPALPLHAFKITHLGSTYRRPYGHGRICLLG